MSASREKKTRHQMIAEGMSEKEIKTYLEEQKGSNSTKLYVIGVAILGIAMVAAVIWNSGFVQRSAVATTINGVDYSVAEMDYYYNSAKQNEIYMSYYGMSTYLDSLSAKDQTQSEGVTYHEYFIAEALAQMQGMQVLATAANDAGYTLPQEDIDGISETIDSLDSQATISGYPSADSYVQANYGQYMTVELLQKIIENQSIAVSYSAEYAESLVYEDDVFETYYAENKDIMDTYELSYLVLRAEAPVAAEGEDPLTEEAIAAGFATEKAIQKEAADAAKLALEAGGDIEKLGETYEAYGAYVDQKVIGSSMNDSYSEWAFDASREVGDISIQEYESDDMHIYYVLRYESRELDETPTADVRHILIGAAETGTIPTDEEYATAKAEAEALLATFEAGAKTPEAFGELAMANSVDTSSAANGGQILGIGQENTYVETFSDWALDTSRAVGDTGVIKNDGSSIMGYHAMYFQEWSDPIWKRTVEATMLEKDLTAWNESLLEGMTTIAGSGTNYLGG